MFKSVEICAVDMSNGINVTYRSSSEFNAIITYNCSSIHSYSLSVIHNQSIYPYCSTFNDYSDDRTVSVTCYNIENSAGRDWTFSLIQRYNYGEIILNKTFAITLQPLLLNSSQNKVYQEERTVIVFIQNCLQISDSQYLVVRCNSSDLSTYVFSNNCTYTCFNLRPGSISNISFVRLSILIIDKDGQTFQEESLSKLYTVGEINNIFFKYLYNIKVFISDLDKITNLYFHDNSEDKMTALIYFNRPYGDYDQITLTCAATDQYCFNGNTYLTNSTGNCSYCNKITISPITRGVTYKCHASTIKQNFVNITSDSLYFNTCK